MAGPGESRLGRALASMRHQCAGQQPVCCEDAAMIPVLVLAPKHTPSLSVSVVESEHSSCSLPGLKPQPPPVHRPVVLLAPQSQL